VSGGVAAAYDEARGLALVLDDTGDQARVVARRVADLAADKLLLAACALVPVLGVRLAEALAGVERSILAAAVRCEADARATRAAVRLLEAADDAQAVAFGGLGALVQNQAGALSLLFPGHDDPVVTTYDAPAGATSAPSSLSDLVAQLAWVADWSPTPDSAGNGTIQVQTFTGSDGVPHHLVYLPGTDDITEMPWSDSSIVRGNEGNVDTGAGHESTYADGILDALDQAGVGPDEPILLAGHSQGGMAAWWLAHHPHGYDIEAVVTAGSPLGPGGPPDGVEVISLENLGDPVPWLDATPNGADPHHTTIGFSDTEADPIGNHGLDHYVVGAGEADASDHPSITAALDQLEASGFLDGGATTAQGFQIVRDDETGSWRAVRL